jgi:cytochrome c-type biogenesis protein CcmH/NrfF
MRAARVLPMVAMLLLLAGSARSADPQDVADRVSRQVMSPFCDGLTVHDCPSQQSVELRAEIVDMARSGMTAGAIVDELVARYGERIRGVPEPEGTDLLLWIIPGLAAAAAIAAAVMLIRRFSARNPGETEAPLSEQERARLNAELGAFRSRM